MDFSDIKNGLEGFVERYVSCIRIGTYRDTDRKSLLKGGLETKANSLWKLAQFVVAKYDNSNEEIEKYIIGWKKLASKENNQYLLLAENDSSWGMYNARGERLGGEEYILDYFAKEKERVRTQKLHELTTNAYNFVSKNQPLQRIYYGAPGTGKTRFVQEEIYEKFNDDNRVFTTFHQSYSYEDFVEGLKPVLVKSKSQEENTGVAGDVKYQIEEGIFKIA